MGRRPSNNVHSDQGIIYIHLPNYITTGRKPSNNTLFCLTIQLWKEVSSNNIISFTKLYTTMGRRPSNNILSFTV